MTFHGKQDPYGLNPYKPYTDSWWAWEKAAGR